MSTSYRYVFTILTMAALTGAGGLQAEVVVSPGNLGTWSLIGTDSSGGAGCVTNCGTASFVNGPDTPPLGAGSVNLNTPAAGSAQLGTSELNGLAVSALTALTYSTYETANNGQQFPYISIDVTYSGGAQSDRWFFEPSYQNTAAGGANCTSNQAAQASNTWQTWNALGGCWWDNKGFAVAGNGSGNPMLTFAQLVGDEPDATIVGSSFNDGLRFRFGFASGGTFDGDVDNVTIGVNGSNTTYNFEETAPAPEPGTIALFGGGLLLFGAIRSKTAIKGRRP